MPALSQATALFHQGTAELQQGLWEAAEAAFRQAVALDAQFAEAHANLGYVCDQRGDAPGAERHWRRALALAPHLASVHLNLGALLAQHKRHAEAEACYAAALALEPQSSAVWSNLGVLNLNLQREETAETCLRQALALEADNHKARFNLAYLQLRRGHWEEGWALFEARDWYRALAERLPYPRWQGQDLTGCRLLLCFEAGHGDVIQFCRYVPLLKARGALHISLLCHPALRRLLASLDGLDGVLPFDQALPEQRFDYWMPLMSAPYHLGTRLDTVPARLPYLQPAGRLQAHWAALLPKRPGLRVGLVWRGNPAFENDADRSLAHLRLLAPLWELPGIHFISLQQGAGEEQAAECGPGQAVLELGGQLQDFADAAAVLQSLDLLITVDTAMAHLAGALGRPCWLLLPWYMADWRWGARGNSSVWYPQVMRLFRQDQDGDWHGTVQAVQRALQEHSMAWQASES